MNLEGLVKFHSPRSLHPGTLFSRASPESLSVTDVMAAAGMMQRRAPIGSAAFAGKMNLSPQAALKAVSLLVAVARHEALHYPALCKLPAVERERVLKVMVIYAFLDFARSAATELPCVSCSGSGMKKGKPCKKCAGKGTVRAACNDCKGRGIAVNRLKTRLQGVPIYHHCVRCGGRGFERIPSTVIYRAVAQVSENISLDTWKKSLKRFSDYLTGYLEKEVSWAETQFQRITK
ncbi:MULTISPECIES: antitermination protein Q [unclassified Pantoea]|uniref:antitermination protein Q n=1 Tax=unclassified Pantoea TaxID=2630326 RepID=UPI00301BFB1C